jgi:hypothetical protein
VAVINEIHVSEGQLSSTEIEATTCHHLPITPVKRANHESPFFGCILRGSRSGLKMIAMVGYLYTHFRMENRHNDHELSEKRPAVHSAIWRLHFLRGNMLCEHIRPTDVFRLTEKARDAEHDISYCCAGPRGPIMEVDLRDQALALISDAQTADKKDKDVYLRQVNNEAMHISDSQTLHAEMEEKPLSCMICASRDILIALTLAIDR